MQGLSVDVHGLADGLKGLVEAGLAKAAGQPSQSHRAQSTGGLPGSFALCPTTLLCACQKCAREKCRP